MKQLTQAFIASSALILASAHCSYAETLEIEATRGGYIESTLDGKEVTFISPVDTQINFLGALGDEGARQIILGFDLPTIDGVFKSAVMEFPMRHADAVSSFPWFNIDAYAFAHEPSEDDFFVGPLDDKKVRVADNLMAVGQTKNGETIRLDLTDFLAPLYRAKEPLIETLYIRLNPDDSDGNLSTGDKREGNLGRYRPIIVTGKNSISSKLQIVTD